MLDREQMLARHLIRDHGRTPESIAKMLTPAPAGRRADDPQVEHDWEHQDADRELHDGDDIDRRFDDLPSVQCQRARYQLVRQHTHQREP